MPPLFRETPCNILNRSKSTTPSSTSTSIAMQINHSDSNSNHNHHQHHNHNHNHYNANNNSDSNECNSSCPLSNGSNCHGYVHANHDETVPIDVPNQVSPHHGQPGHTDSLICSRVKCVLIGDGAVGKTSLIVSYTTNGYPTEYVPTAFDNYSVVVTVDNQPLRLQLCDTAGQDDFDTLRPLSYPQTHVFLLCFSVVCPTSFHNITEKWLPEIKKHCKQAPVILIGTQCDLRHDVKVLIELAQHHEQPVNNETAKRVANKIGAFKYIECSALTQKNLKDVFDSAILAGLEHHQNMMNKINSKPSILVSWGKSRGKKLLKNSCNFSDTDEFESSSNTSTSTSMSISTDSSSLPPKPYLRKESCSPQLNQQQQQLYQHSSKVKRQELELSKKKKGWRRLCCGL